MNGLVRRQEHRETTRQVLAVPQPFRAGPSRGLESHLSLKEPGRRPPLCSRRGCAPAARCRQRGASPRRQRPCPRPRAPLLPPVASASGGAQTRTPRGGATPRALDAPLPFLGRAMLELSAEAKAKGARAGLPLSRNQINAPKIPGQCVGAARNNACPLPAQGGRPPGSLRWAPTHRAPGAQRARG